MCPPNCVKRCRNSIAVTSLKSHISSQSRGQFFLSRGPTWHVPSCPSAPLYGHRSIRERAGERSSIRGHRERCCPENRVAPFHLHIQHASEAAHVRHKTGIIAGAVGAVKHLACGFERLGTSHGSNQNRNVLLDGAGQREQFTVAEELSLMRDGSLIQEFSHDFVRFLDL